MIRIGINHKDTTRPRAATKVEDRGWRIEDGKRQRSLERRRPACIGVAGLWPALPTSAVRSSLLDILRFKSFARKQGLAGLPLCELCALCGKSFLCSVAETT